MDNFSPPVVYPIHEGSFVTVPSESWKELCKVLNDVVETLNSLSENLISYKQVTDAELSKFNSDISKIAKILEDVYEKID
jgi:hypothetical protein